MLGASIRVVSELETSSSVDSSATGLHSGICRYFYQIDIVADIDGVVGTKMQRGKHNSFSVLCCPSVVLLSFCSQLRLLKLHWGRCIWRKWYRTDIGSVASR